MAVTNKRLVRATAPYAYFEPGLFGRRWLKEVDRFFDRAEVPFGTREELAWVPDLEVFEKNDELVVRLDVPGLKKEEVAVNVVGGMLTIEGERQHEKEEEKNHWYTRERTYGKFQRTVPLPEGVNVKAIAATFKNGVLEITVPRPPAVEAPSHRVEVRGADEKVPGAAE